MPNRKNKVVIIGGGSDHGIEIDKDKFEYWTVNNCYLNKEQKPTHIFELHHIRKIDGVWYRRDSKVFGTESVDYYINNLKELDIPIYMQQKIKDVPKSIQFPIVEVLDRFPRGYFNNSIAWMVGFAIIKNFKEIHLHNICKITENFSEYLVHKFSTEYMLGVAEGLGIKVYVSESSELLKSKYLYGYQENINSYEKHVDYLRNGGGNYSKYDLQDHLGIAHI